QPSRAHRGHNPNSSRITPTIRSAAQIAGSAQTLGSTAKQKLFSTGFTYRHLPKADAGSDVPDHAVDLVMCKASWRDYASCGGQKPTVTAKESAMLKTRPGEILRGWSKASATRVVRARRP